MAIKDSAGLKPDVSPQEMLDLGQLLASMSDFQAQKVFLENFLEKRFGVSANIWLRSPAKSITTRLPKMALPFDPYARSQREQAAAHRSQTYEIKNTYWGVIPIVFGEEDFAKIIIKHDCPLEDHLIEKLMKISKIAGLAIYAVLQVNLNNWRQKQLNLVRSVTARISQITELDVLTNEISRLIQETFKYHYVAVFLIHESTGRLHFKASAGPDESDRPEFEQDSHPGFELGEHMIGHVANTGAELVANDVTKEPRYQQVDCLAATKAEVVLPLKVESQIFGVLDVQAVVKNAFDENDLLVLRALADNIAIAIESTRLYEGVQSRAEQLAMVSDVSRAITYILDTDKLLQQIVNLIHERFEFPYVHLYTVDPIHQRITFKAGSGDRTSLYEEAGITFDIDSKHGILPWVVKNRQTKRVSDVKSEPLYIKTSIAQAFEGSEMAVPLSFGGEVLGVLDLQSDEKNAFSLEDQQLMETLADNLAIAIRNARLYRSEKWRRQVAESLRDVAGLLSENIALGDVLNAILVELHKNLPCDIAGIWLYKNNQKDEDRSEASELFLAAYKTADNYSDDTLDSLTYAPDEWIKTALSKREPKIRQGDESIGPIAKLYDLPADYSAIAAPLHTGDEAMGMLTMIHHTPGRYGYESERITSAFASYAAIAIKNTRLYATSQEQAWISTILLQVAHAIQSLTNLDELVNTIVRLTPMVVGVKGCALLLKAPESKVFQLSAMYGIGQTSEEKKLDLPFTLIDPPIIEKLLLLKEPLRVLDPLEDLNLPAELADQLAKDALIMLPLMSRNEILGAFLLVNEAQPTQQEQLSNVLSEERYNIVQGILQQTAVAIENIRLIEARQEEAYISAVLLQVAQAAVSSTDLQDTLESIVNIMPILIGIDASVVYLWDDGENRFTTSHATSRGYPETDEIIGTTYQPGDFPMLDVVFRNNRPLVYPFIETSLSPEDWDLALPDEGQTNPSPILNTHYPLLMGFPLSVKDDIFGVMLAQDENFATNRERRFELLSGIAQQASLAIQNDLLNKEMLDRHRLEREFQLAREIQQTFLPNEILDLPGWKMGVHWETARQVGGDFYDYFLLSDGRLAFVIADVSDKGLAASLYMAVTRTLLRAAAEEMTSPARTLEHVNDLLLKNSQNGLFVTTFYGILNLDDGQLTYTIAGHNPPLIIRQQHNDIIMLKKGGIALGALPDIHLQQRETVLAPGDCLLLYTDGLTEAFNLEDEMYGDDRLIEVLSTVIGTPPSAVLDVIEADLDRFRNGAPLSDDTTMLAICRSNSLRDDHGNTGTS